MTNRTGAPSLRPRGFWNPAVVQNVPLPPPSAPCPARPASTALKPSSNERPPAETGVDGDPLPRLLNVARVVLEVFSRLGRRLRCVVQPPPPRWVAGLFEIA